MTPTPRRRNVIVGLFILFAVTILGAGVLVIGDIKDTFTRKIAVSAVFNGVNGLQKGDNVWFSGVKVGIVKRLSFVGESDVFVEMLVDRSATQFIRADALVKIGSDGLIGNRIVLVYGGTAGTPDLEDGGTLAIGKTVTSEEIMTVLQENNMNLLAITSDLKAVTHKLGAGEGTLGRLLQDDGLYVTLDETVTTLSAASTSARALADSGATFARKLNQEGTLANDIATDRTSYKKLAATVDSLRQTGAKADSLVDGLAASAADPSTPFGTVMHDTAAGGDVKRTLDNLDTSSALLAQDLEALQHNFLFRGYFKKQEKARAVEKARRALEAAEAAKR